MRRLVLCIAALLGGALDARAETAPAIRTVVALGTSLTADGGWVEALEKKLEDCTRRQVRVLNFGGSAKTSTWGRAQISRVAAARPDLLLIEFAINDAHLLKGFARTQARENIRAIVDGVRARVPGVRVVLLSLNPVHGLRGWLRPRYNWYNDDYAGLAALLGARWIDLRPAWERSGLDLAAAIPDGVHPAREAANVTADVLGAGACGA